MDLKTYLQQNTVYLDGGMGTLLQESGLPLGELPERWNVTHAEVVQGIHKAYFDAGSNIVATNTFGANGLKFSDEELEQVIAAAVHNARQGAKLSDGVQEKWVALDIGPCGKLLKPYGDLEFEDAVALFAKTVRLGVKYGVDLLLIETMNDSLECKAAVLAAKENSNLPVFVSCAFGEDGKLMTGASPAAMVAMLEGLGVDAFGVNCSVGPKQLANTVAELLACASVPVLVKPNAGLPVERDGKTVFDVSEEEFADFVANFVKKGARLVGGCCGTTPSYIQKVVAATKEIPVQPLIEKWDTVVSSYTHAVKFNTPVIIGERINPTGKKRFKQALLENDVAYVLAEGIAQEENGAHILDVNVGLPDLDETAELPKYIQELQAITSLPLQIDTSNYAAMERAMRIYNGKPLVNSVNGKQESMDAVFPLVKKYGGVVIALTLDENGIPDTADGRVKIARKIIEEGAKYGISRKDFLVDPLAMAISADPNAAKITLESLVRLRGELGVGTSLGVSNVSFGLPCRDAILSTFFAYALEKGLSAAIINPNSAEMMKVYYAYLALSGRDSNCSQYVGFITEHLPKMSISTVKTPESAQKVVETGEKSPLKAAVIHGLKDAAEKECSTLLTTINAQEIIEEHIVPALNTVGQAYEEKRAFLPQLLMSADAAKAAFECIKVFLAKDAKSAEKKTKIVLATVKGDIHDIGKNIVGTILSNYGYQILDLGKDVPPETIVECVLREKASIVGLSALMTTTVPSMEETIRLLKTNAPNVKVMVGGAVLTAEYAQKISADGYAKDAMQAVRIVNAWTNEQ